MRRRYLLLNGLALPAAAVAGSLFWLGHADLSHLAEARLAKATGRAVHIGHMHVTPGMWLDVEADDVSIANIPGGSKPQMLTLGHMSAEVRLLSLLGARTPEIRHLDIQKFFGVFERLSDRTPNWDFGQIGEESRTRGSHDADPGPVPGLRDARIRSSEIVYRSAEGHTYRISLSDVAITSETDQSSILMNVTGAYNDLPVAIAARLGTVSQLGRPNEATPIRLDAKSGDLTITLDGTATDLFDFDGIVGALSVTTETSAPLMALAGSPPEEFSKNIEIKGNFTHNGDVWTIANGEGAIADSAIKALNLTYVEGARGKPDRISGGIGFKTLDINQLVPKTHENPIPSKHTDIEIAAPQNPDPLFDLRLSANSVRYNTFEFSDASLHAVQTSGHIQVPDLKFSWLGGSFSATGEIGSQNGKSDIRATIDITHADIDRFRRQAGLAPVPINGTLSFLVKARADGVRTLNEASSAADVEAVVGMNSGEINQKVMDLASLNVGMLFQSDGGITPITCMLGALVMHRGEGAVVPLRIYTAKGSIVGEVMFNLDRRWFELAFQSRTPGFLALDIPIRVSGPFNNPSFGLAGWSKQGRELLRQAHAVSSLPPNLDSFEPGRKCLQTR